MKRNEASAETRAERKEEDERHRQVYAAPSARVKTDIKRVGETDGGLGVYTFRYKWGGPVQMGVLAQEVEQVTPSAVHEFGGIKAVDYAEIS
jgi:hypothetical protein